MLRSRLGVLCLAAAFSLTGCVTQWSTPTIHGTWWPASTEYVCLDLPAKQIPAAEKAVSAWDKSLHQWRHLVSLPGETGEQCGIRVHQVDHPDPDPNGNKEALAWTNRVGGNDISMRKGYYEFDTTGILLHELGHAFGAQHVPNTLMNAHWYRHSFICPDMTTVAQVAAYNHIRLGLLRWCY